MNHDDADHPFVPAFLAIGSNLGDRLAHLQLAVDALAHVPGVVLEAVSRVYETTPVGGPPQDAYLNAVVAISTNLDPHELLHRSQQIEASAARERIERWGPRTLDVDVLLVDDRRVDEPELTLPHPRMSGARLRARPAARRRAGTRRRGTFVERRTRTRG